MRTKPIDLTFGAVFVCLMAIGANITVWFPFLAIPLGGTSVPLSLQTFFAIIAGMMLGKKRASYAMITYILVGTAGLPIFAGLSAGPMQLISPTGGFIFSFVFIAFFVGWITEKQEKARLHLYSLAALVGVAFNYGIGVTYMYVAMNTWLELPVTYELAWIGMIPFLIKDIALSCLAALFILQLEKRVPAKWMYAKAS